MANSTVAILISNVGFNSVGALIKSLVSIRCCTGFMKCFEDPPIAISSNK